MSIKNKWTYVTKDEFTKFVKNYPRELVTDYYMDYYSWNDFADGRKWPESMVAKVYAGPGEEEFKISTIYLEK